MAYNSPASTSAYKFALKFTVDGRPTVDVCMI